MGAPDHRSVVLGNQFRENCGGGTLFSSDLSLSKLLNPSKAKLEETT